MSSPERNVEEALFDNTKDSSEKGLIDALNLVQAVIEFELDGTVIHANDNFLNALGYSLDEVQGQHHRMFCEEAFHKSLEYKQLWKNLANGEFQSGEFKRVTKDGDTIWILASYNPVLDENGTPYKVVKFASDVTANKNEAAEFNAKLQAVGKSQAVIEFDLNTVVLDANENFLATTGYQLSDIVGKKHSQFVAPEYAASAEYAAFWDKLRSGVYDAGEYKRFAKDGSEIWINAAYHPVFDAEGNVAKIVKFATDITVEKNAAALTSTKIAAVNRVQAVIEFDLNGTVVNANDNFLNTVGYTLDEIKGSHHSMFCEKQYVDSPEYKSLWNNLRNGEINQGEYKRIGKHGKEIWINASYNPVLDSNNTPVGVIKFATDITEQKLKDAENQYKLEAISKSQAVIEFDTKGNIITANEAFLTTLGYSLSDIVGKHHKIFCDPTYTSTKEYESFWDKLSSGVFDSGRYCRYDRNNQPVWIQATYNPIFDPSGKVSKVVKYATDISAQVAIEESVTKISRDVAEQTHSIATKASGVATGAQTLGATSEEMNASVEELSASIDSIADNSRQADNIAKNTQSEADQGVKAIERSIESMQNINDSAVEISEIVKVIGEIANQTNMLAFNAAIEAARAGEHGLGFSVVADEVRKLAERSSQATKEITKLINESVKRIVEGSEISREASAAFNQIVAGVEKTTHAIAEISMAAQEQQVAARDVSNAIQQIADSTEDSVMATDSIAKATDTLLECANTLQVEVKKFTD